MNDPIGRRLGRFTVPLALVAAAITSQPHLAAAVPYGFGDVFAGVGAGQVKHFDASGTLLETLDTTSGSAEEAGMCFDASGDLYVTNFSTGNMTKFDNMGALLTFPWGGPFSVHPESCVLDGAGNVYTGEVDGASDIRKFDQAGTLLASFDNVVGPRGTDWLDLASDQCTIFYASEGSSIRRFDVCANMQQPDFCSSCGAALVGMRIRPDASGEVFAADFFGPIRRFDSTGTEMQTYTAPGLTNPFAFNLDPDGTTFWTADFSSGEIFRFNISSGAVVTQFNAGILGSSLDGLAIFGERVAGRETNCADGIDNDSDGLTDCADPDCALDPACTGGACSNVVCTAEDECHEAGICDPATGICSNPPAPDGTPCGNGGSCTQGVCNQPPDCSAAAASRGELWPPNHKLNAVSVAGVVDPDGDNVTITITSITQDEPINGLGDGDTCPDATGVGTTTAKLRAERSGTGDGRVYHVSFSADDGRGGQCTGVVAVCVPHDQRPGHVCVDQGSKVNSAGPCK